MCRETVVHENDFQLFRHLDGMEGLFLDVGANVGQSALSLFAVNETLNVLSLEPNIELKGFLEAVKKGFPSRFEYRLVGASNVSGKAVLTVPRSQIVGLTDSSSLFPDRFERPWIRDRLQRKLVESGFSDSFELDSVNVDVVTIDSLAITPLVIKIDVEGFERWALLGAERTIRKRFPLLLIENNTDFPETMRLLRSWGYEYFRYECNKNQLIPWPWDPRTVLNSFLLHESMEKELSGRLVPLICR